MSNLVEIVIQGNDQTGQAFQSSTTGAQNLGRAIESGPNISLRSLRRAAIVAVAALYGLERGLQKIVDRAKELGYTNVSADFDKLKASIQSVGDAILASPLYTAGGKTSNFLDLLDQGFNNLIPVARAAGVVFIMAAGGLDFVILSAQRLSGVLAELTGQTTTYTDAWYKAAITQDLFIHNQEIGQMWAGKFTQAIQQQNGVMVTAGKAAANMNNLLSRQNQLLQQRRAIADAIRSGDALALSNAMSGAMTGGSVTKGGGPAGPRGGGAPGNVTVHVALDGEPIAAIARGEIASAFHGSAANPGK